MFDNCGRFCESFKHAVAVVVIVYLAFESIMRVIKSAFLTRNLLISEPPPESIDVALIVSA